MWIDVINKVSDNLSRFGLSGIGHAGQHGAQPRIFAPIPHVARCLLRGEFEIKGLNWDSVQIDAAVFTVLKPLKRDFFGAAIGILRRAFVVSEQPSKFRAGERLGGLGEKGGTLGCLLVDNSGEYYFLTANHAVPQRDIYKWTPIAVETKASDCVATLGGGLDCAVGKIQDYYGDPYKPDPVPGIVCDPWGRKLKYDLSPAPSNGEDVRQCGSTKRPGKGRIYDPGLVSVDVIYGSQVRSFSDIVVVEGSNFADEGDSGSIVYRVVGNDLDAVGLLFARSKPGYFLAFPMQKVLAAVPNLKLPP